jgi:lipoprotein-anchoring transpeptidase ErfK/SrfK
MRPYSEHLRHLWRGGSRSGLLLPVGGAILLLFLVVALLTTDLFKEQEVKKIPWPQYHAHYVLDRDVRIRDYFSFVEQLAFLYDSILPYPLDEYLLVRHNPWIIDSLAATDYYHLMERGIFCKDQQSLVILEQGDSLFIPNARQVQELQRKQAMTILDVNIPEYKLRIVEDGEVKYSFPVRVGRKEKKYLAMADREVDLQTHTGEGKIVRVNRSPLYINPSDNKRYKVTRRDDGRVTRLPRIPWLEPEINGQRLGQLIHPTTNRKTLGKAYSNGCIGTAEADMWYIYYYAPLGTRVVIRYDLQADDDNGDVLFLKDIYQ